MRVEKQTFGGTAPQPSVRALWTPNEQQSFWLAWSKTVRSPSVVDRTMGAYAGAMPPSATTPLPMLLYAAPGEQSNFGNEKVRTIEAGHRAQWSPTFYSDLTAYVSKYDGIFGMLVFNDDRQHALVFRSLLIQHALPHWSTSVLTAAPRDCA